MGRRKIEIKKIENKAYLKATFSKRRKGLFTKAKELCKLCGAVIAILTISPGGRFYNFGEPDVDSVVSRYCDDDGTVREFITDTSDTIAEDHDIASTSHEEDEDEDLDFVTEDEEDVSEDEELKDEEEEEEDDEVDEDVLPIDFETSDNAGEEEQEQEEEPVEEIKEMNLIDKINERDWSMRRSMSQQKFWWDEEEPIDVEQRQMYHQSLTQLRNNVNSLLSERKMRESCAKDYISMI